MKREWKVYLPFMANQFKKNLAYKGSFYLFIVTSLFTPFISYCLWMAIYGSSSTGVLGGLTRAEMIVYVFMTYVTTDLVRISISGDIIDGVMDGSVVMTLLKPLDYRLSLISKAIGESMYRFLAPVGLVWIGLEVYKATVLGMGVTPIKNILCYLCSLVMSFLIYVLFEFCYGMVAFVTTYMFGMNMAKNALVGFLSGQLIPISFFPEIVQKIFEFMPFSSMVYAPVMVYLGKYEGISLAAVLGKQLFWVVFLYALGSFLWGRITKRIVVLGG